MVDLPGYGYAKRGKREMEKLQNLIEHYVLEREELTQLFVLIDSRLEPQLSLIHISEPTRPLYLM